MYPLFNKNGANPENQEFYDSLQGARNGNSIEVPKLPNCPLRNPQQYNIGVQMAALKLNDPADNHNYDDTDDDEPEHASPQPTFINPRDLPVPDAAYVAKTVPTELQSMIAKNCKKDCRSWLWKSKAQKAKVEAGNHANTSRK